MQLVFGQILFTKLRNVRHSGPGRESPVGLRTADQETLIQGEPVTKGQLQDESG
jgi:hypothetical protein